MRFSGAFELLDLRVIPVPVMHGDAEIAGYRIGRFAYLTDFSAVPEHSIEVLEGVDVVFLDALRHVPHPTHSTVENSLQVAARIGAAQTYFTHICHDLPHEATNRTLPPGVRLSYDGLRIEIDLEN